jgi:DNA-binding GntR family transcriptional regulator
MQREYDAMVSSAKRGDERQLWTHDRAFHMALLCASGNIRLANYLDSLRHAVLRRGVTTAGRSRSLPDIAAAHLPVLSAALAGDEAMAARAMQLHIVRTSQLLTLNFADFEQHH